MLKNISAFPRCPPRVRVPTPGERLAGVIDDLNELAAQAAVERVELAIVVTRLREALISAGLRDQGAPRVPAGRGWVPGAALRPAIHLLRSALWPGGAK